MEQNWTSLNTVLGSDWELFRQAVAGAKRYAEWGAGESSLWLSRNTEIRFRSIETDLTWVEKLNNALGGESNGEVIRVDLGEVERWGRPVSYNRFENIGAYLNAPFAEDFDPEVVLIDGRFRVACFFTSLLSASTGTKLVFDDYVSRRYYHIVENFLLPQEVSNRQALFVVPAEIDRNEIADWRSRFEFVMD